MTLSHKDMAFELAKMRRSKEAWLDTFGHGKSKRSDSEIETRRLERDVLAKAESDYRAAAERHA